MPHIKLTTEQAVSVHHTPFTIGSDPACDLTLQGQNVLPRHLLLQSRGDVWQAATLSSRAAVFINDQPLDSLALLKDGDRIRVGDVTMIWREQGAPIPQQSPWKGLLLIFLIVVSMLSVVFGWYGLSNGRGLTSSPDAIPAHGGGADNEGDHPVYRIILPAPWSD